MNLCGGWVQWGRPWDQYPYILPAGLPRGVYMRSVNALVAMSVALVFVLAGCFGGTPDPGSDEGGEDPITDLSLADLGCDYVYPDNTTPVDCDNGFTVIDVEQTERPSIVGDTPRTCVWEGTDLRMPVSLHWDAEQEIYGIYYDAADIEGTFSGLFYTRSGEAPDGNIMAVWYDAPTSGFVPLPAPDSDLEVGEQHQFVMRFYTHDFETPTPELQNGTIRAYWSVFEDRPYPLQVLETDDDAFYFNKVNETDHATFPYDLEPFSVSGQDFNITVDAEHYLSVRTAFNHLPTYQCSV